MAITGRESLYNVKASIDDGEARLKVVSDAKELLDTVLKDSADNDLQFILMVNVSGVKTEVIGNTTPAGLIEFFEVLQYEVMTQLGGKF